MRWARIEVQGGKGKDLKTYNLAETKRIRKEWWNWTAKILITRGSGRWFGREKAIEGKHFWNKRVLLLDPKNQKVVQRDASGISETVSDAGFWKKERPMQRNKGSKTEKKRRSWSRLMLMISRNLEAKWKREMKRCLGKSYFAFTVSTDAGRWTDRQGPRDWTEGSDFMAHGNN